MQQSYNALLISLIAFAAAVVVLLYALAAARSREIIYGHSKVKRHGANPVISPQSWNDWEAAGTFNPAAIQDDKGGVHLLYRAIGSDGVSRIGYASSKDGLRFDDRSDYPVFAMRKPRENIVEDVPDDLKKPDPVMFPSGGSWGGCEDPRLVRIGDNIYMTYNAFDGWDFIRIAVTSIKASDFFNKRWNWRRPIFISSKNQINKNWVLFPEKINGKFAIIHSIVPKIEIEYVDSIDSIPREIESPRKSGPQPGRPNHWDNLVRSAGPPPLKTDRGWLLLYHAMDKKEPQIGYKLGAMLLDLAEPTKVIARSPAPILVPSEWYENDWKPGVVYACGATIKNNDLFVYYGGGDKHVCVAHTPLKGLLDWLNDYGKID
ncbi:hypothetical protein KGQ27_01830 [Patescibacteria group bacterium]|nr:hypothetical protein [Patescibacteria group bacterium]MDE1946343.1 hypothetical protein [Patescibacteria group bacterium]MDE2010795.1 hypothetical protein [Patescibacteria group bacterium]MDE2233272.1 hypothetical protein [Patescibacteria group bacterium]